MTAPAREAVAVVAQAQPDQAVTGWRTWFVLPQENLLRPIYMRGMVWRPRQPHEALCPETLHVPPHEGCKCGIWAVLEPDQLEEISWTVTPPQGVDKLPGRLVVGQVSMWGRLLQHNRGWRSSHGYPKHLYVFTQDAAVAAALRDAYLVPVEYGEKAALLRQLLPGASTPAAATTPSVTPPAPAAPVKPPPSRVARILKAGVKPLPDGPLKELAEKRVRAAVEWLDRTDWWNADKELEQREKDFRCAQDTLRRGIARGGYRVDRNRLGWKAVLRENLKVERTQYVLVRMARRAATKGETTTARRIAWLAVATRWRKAREPYREALDLKESLRTKRNRITGDKLKITTIYQKKGRLAIMEDELSEQLQALVEVPTPSYHDWRRMF